MTGEVYHQDGCFHWEHDEKVEDFPAGATLDDVRTRIAQHFGVEPEQIRFRSEVVEALKRMAAR